MLLAGGRRIEAHRNVLVGLSPYLLGRNRGVWGDDVLDFRPDRFANGKRAGDATHSYAWLPFGYGARGSPPIALHIPVTFAFSGTMPVPARGITSDETLYPYN